MWVSRDPGRQSRPALITGSFHPLNAEGWSDCAHTARGTAYCRVVVTDGQCLQRAPALAADTRPWHVRTNGQPIADAHSVERAFLLDCRRRVLRAVCVAFPGARAPTSPTDGSDFSLVFEESG